MKKNIHESVDLLLPMLTAIFDAYLNSNSNEEENLMEMVSLAMSIGISFLFTTMCSIASQDKVCSKKIEKIKKDIIKVIKDSDLFVSSHSKDKQ